MADGVQKNYALFLGTTIVDNLLHPGITYRGYAKINVAADTSKAIWLISREYYLSGVLYVEHASFHHDQIWEDRGTLFPAIIPDAVGSSDLGLGQTRTTAEVTSPVSAGTEFFYDFDVGTKQFMIIPDKRIVRWYYASSSGGVYIPVGLGACLHRTRLDIQGASTRIYLKCDSSSVTFKIEEWV